MAALRMVMRSILQQSVSRRVIYGFEARALDGLRARIDQMPTGTATLKIGSHPLDLESPFPYFEVTPANSNSAPMSGSVSDAEGIGVTIGKAAGRDLWISGGNLFKGMPCEEEFLLICNSVFTSRFTEECICSQDGRVLRSRLVIGVNTKSVLFGKGTLIRWPFTKTRKELFSYEPYC